MKLSLTSVFVTLVVIAVILGIITAYMVFVGTGGTYVVQSPLGGPDASIFSTTSTTPPTSGTASSSSLAPVSSSASSTASSSPTASGSSTPAAAAPISWQEGNETLTITGATIIGTQLTLSVQVAMGQVAECVPLDLRLIADEQGDLSPPITPQFTFPDTGSCTGTPGETYSGQQVVFNVANPTTFPFLLTTGGTSNILFEIVQNPDGSLSVQLPPNAG